MGLQATRPIKTAWHGCCPSAAPRQAFGILIRLPILIIVTEIGLSRLPRGRSPASKPGRRGWRNRKLHCRADPPCAVLPGHALPIDSRDVRREQLSASAVRVLSVGEHAHAQKPTRAGGRGARRCSPSPESPTLLRVWLAGSGLSLDDDLQRFHIEHCFGEQFLQPGILHLEVLEPAGFRDFHAAELCAPRVERRVLNPCFLHSSLTGMPGSASFRNPMICCSVKRFFMFVFFSENELY